MTSWVGPDLPTNGATSRSPAGQDARRSPRWFVPAVVLLALAVFGAGIRGTYRAMFPGQGLYRMVAVVEQAPRDGVVVVTHDAVSGLMGQMSSMALFAESQAALDHADLRAGDRARFTLRQLPSKLLIVDVQKIR